MNHSAKHIPVSKIRDILLNIWDPIGIQTFPEASDEYDLYIDHIHKIITTGSKDELFEYLMLAEREYMGLEPDKDKSSRVADLLMRLR